MNIIEEIKARLASIGEVEVKKIHLAPEKYTALALLYKSLGFAEGSMNGFTPMTFRVPNGKFSPATQREDYTAIPVFLMERPLFGEDILIEAMPQDCNDADNYQSRLQDAARQNDELREEVAKLNAELLHWKPRHAYEDDLKYSNTIQDRIDSGHAETIATLSSELVKAKEDIADLEERIREIKMSVRAALVD